MITYKDTCTLVIEDVDGYGDRSINNLSEIPCLFLQSTGNSHTGNVEIANSDAHIYLDPTHPMLLAFGYKLEGKTIIVNPLGTEDDNSWYKITRVVVGQRKLLDNNVDNVHAYLSKIARTQT